MIIICRAVQVDQRNFEFVVQLCELYLLELRRLETMVVVPPTGKLAEARIKAQLYFQTYVPWDPLQQQLTVWLDKLSGLSNSIGQRR